MLLREELIEIDFKELQEFYPKAINNIDGMTTGQGLIYKSNIRNYFIIVWSPIPKKKLKPMFIEYINNPEIERLEIGQPCDFNYDEFVAGKSEYVFLNGKPFKGFYKK